MNKKRRRLKKSVKRALAGIVAAVIVLTIALVAGGNREKEPPVPTNPDIGKETVYKIELMDVYPQDLRTLYDKNEEARDFVLSYFLEKDKEQYVDISDYKYTDTVPHFLQWDTRWGYMDYGGECVGVAGCGPVALSMVGYYLTRDEYTFSPEKVVEYALDEGYCYSDTGTSWSLMTEGAEDMGLTVETLPLDEDYIIESVTSGKPVILIMGPGVFTSVGHFIVVHGYEDGYFLINDPNSIKRTEKRWQFSEFSDQILNIWSYSY